MKHATSQSITRLLLGLLPIVVALIMASILVVSPDIFDPNSVLAAPNALPTVSFTNATFTWLENSGTATVDVELSAVPTQTVTVEYFTVQGDATPGSDYSETSGTLTFTVGSSDTESFSITIVNDNVFEGDETVNLVLENPVNATLGTLRLATLIIDDDDTAPTSTPTRTPTGNQPIFADQYEPNSTFADATQIAAGQRFCNITLWPVGDEDYFTFFAKDGFNYQIFTDNLEAGVDTVLTVYNPQGNVIATNDDFDGERRSEVEIEANQDGFYFARIINQDPSDPADKTYCLEVAEIVPPTSTPTSTPVPPLGGDDCEWNSDIEHACLIGVGETKSLNFVPTQGSERDTDIFRLWVKVGIQYTCETLNLSAFTDTNIILWDQNGNPFNPWIGNDDREDATGDTPDFSSKVTYLAAYTGWLHIVVGPVNPPAYEDSPLHTYELTCTSSAATATPTPTATFVFVPPSTGGTGGTSATNTPVATSTIIVFPSPLPTSTPYTPPPPTATPTPPIVQFQPLPTATSISGGGQDVTINVTLYYDVNDSYTPELTEGVANVAVFLFDSATGNLLSFGTTNETGTIRFTGVMASGPVRVVVPFLNYNQIIVGGNEDLLLRIAPQPLPIGIP